MANVNDDILEQQCEDAVFNICCKRQDYSVKCAKHLETYLKLTTKKLTAKVRTEPVPNFDKPIITDEQRKLFRTHETPSEFEVKKRTSKSDIKDTLIRLKELESIVKQIERSKSNEIHQLLKL